MSDIPPVRGSADLAGLIDHALTKADVTTAQVRRLCVEARQNHFHSVCVNPIFAALPHRELAGSAITTCSVIAFPFGVTTTVAKAAEARQAVADGAATFAQALAQAGATRMGASSGVAMVTATSPARRPLAPAAGGP